MPINDYSHLMPETRAWVEAEIAEYDLEAHRERLLIQAGEVWDRLRTARAVIEKEGAFWTDEKGRPRKHPALDCERNDRIVFARLLRELNLDVEPPPDSRPPGLRY